MAAGKVVSFISSWKHRMGLGERGCRRRIATRHLCCQAQAHQNEDGEALLRDLQSQPRIHVTYFKRMKIAQLKSIARIVGQPETGKKQELAQRLFQHFEQAENARQQVAEAGNDGIELAGFEAPGRVGPEHGVAEDVVQQELEEGRFEVDIITGELVLKQATEYGQQSDGDDDTTATEVREGATTSAASDQPAEAKAKEQGDKKSREKEALPQRPVPTAAPPLERSSTSYDLAAEQLRPPLPEWARGGAPPGMGRRSGRMGASIHPPAQPAEGVCAAVPEASANGSAAPRLRRPADTKLSAAPEVEPLRHARADLPEAAAAAGSDAGDRGWQLQHGYDIPGDWREEVFGEVVAGVPAAWQEEEEAAWQVEEDGGYGGEELRRVGDVGASSAMEPEVAEMTVTWLGTSSGTPTLWRNNSCILLRHEGRGLVVDCGEGSHNQMRRAGVDIAAIQHIYITHMHGDHVFGLPALLQAISAARGAEGCDAPVRVMGTPGIHQMLLTSAAADPSPFRMRLEVTELVLDHSEACEMQCTDPQRNLWLARQAPDQHQLVEDVYRAPRLGSQRPGQRAQRVLSGLSWSLPAPDGLTVRAAQLQHRLPCWGFVFQETAPPGAGARARKVVLLGDTCNSEAIASLAMDADLLSHEATFTASLQGKAEAAQHSTAAMAGSFARRIRARQLVLTHYSAGIVGSDNAAQTAGQDQRTLRALLQEASSSFGSSVTAAKDLLTCSISA